MRAVGRVQAVGYWVGTIPGTPQDQSQDYIGIARAQPLVQQGVICVRQALQALQAFRTPGSSHSAYGPPSLNKDEIQLNIS